MRRDLPSSLHASGGRLDPDVPYRVTGVRGTVGVGRRPGFLDGGQRPPSRPWLGSDGVDESAFLGLLQVEAA